MSKASSNVAAALLLALALVGPLAAGAAPGEGQGAAPPKGAVAPDAPAPAAPVTPAAPVAAAPAAPQPAATGELLVPGSEFRYDATGRRDPFKSLLELEKKQRDVSLLPPIQQVDLEAFKVVGVVVDPVSGAQAMVRGPNNQTFVVRVGTIIGKNEGEVLEITLSGIRVLEKYLDFMNRETRKETFLKSHPTAGK
jgi:hypothetical protein